MKSSAGEGICSLASTPLVCATASRSWGSPGPLSHTPLIVGAGYVNSGGLLTSIALSLVLGLPLAFLFAYGSYRWATLWPAVFFHSFHNTISQWLFPKFFAGGEKEFWLGEGGLFPLSGYVMVAVMVYVWMRSRGQSWEALAQSALESQRGEPAAALRHGSQSR